MYAEGPGSGRGGSRTPGRRLRPASCRRPAGCRCSCLCRRTRCCRWSGRLGAGDAVGVVPAERRGNRRRVRHQRATVGRRHGGGERRRLDRQRVDPVAVLGDPVGAAELDAGPRVHPDLPPVPAVELLDDELPRQAQVAVVRPLVDQLRRDRAQGDPAVAQLARAVGTSSVVTAGERRGRLQTQGARRQLGGGHVRDGGRGRVGPFRRPRDGVARNSEHRAVSGHGDVEHRVGHVDAVHALLEIDVGQPVVLGRHHGRDRELAHLGRAQAVRVGVRREVRPGDAHRCVAQGAGAGAGAGAATGPVVRLGGLEAWVAVPTPNEAATMARTARPENFMERFITRDRSVEGGGQIPEPERDPTLSADCQEINDPI